METKEITISKNSNGTLVSTPDLVAVEEPLEISILSGDSNYRISITMRTPGNDKELAAGFLFTEGIIQKKNQIEMIRHSRNLSGAESNYIEVKLAGHVNFNPESIQRNFYTTSSCGVCGKASIDAIKTTGTFTNSVGDFTVQSEILGLLPGILRREQETFDKTGGIHGSGIFTTDGKLIMQREDVGRHNAVDKVIGRAFLDELLPLNRHLLLLSGRASFELIQKAAMAGIKMVLAVGAPSSLAVETARETGITLIGFLAENRYNIYTHPELVIHQGIL